MSDLGALLAGREMVLVAGAGGVGKTTIAAAMGIAAVRRQRGKVLVLTVDPARRLATSLGIERFGNVPVRIDDAALRTAGARTKGELFAAMLDTKAGWDELIHRHAPDAAVEAAVLANPLYQNITGRFVHSHDYLAMEQLHDVHATGEFDLVIVDTPPSRNALSVLDAPGRMAEFFGSRLLRWLTVPYRSRLFSVASRPFYQVADRVLGSRFLEDIADFFVLFQAMERGFVRRARDVEALLVDPADRVRDRHHARDRPGARGAVPRRRAATARHDPRRDRRQSGAAHAPRRRQRSHAARSALPQPSSTATSWRRWHTVSTSRRPTSPAVLTVLAERFDDVASGAARELDRRAELEPFVADAVGGFVSVPWMDDDVHGLDDLVELAHHLGPPG